MPRPLAFPNTFSFGRKGNGGLFAPKGDQRSKSASPSRSNSFRGDSSALNDLNVLGKAGGEILVNTAFNALHIASDFSGVPGLFAAVTILDAISDLCMNVRRNRNEAKQLCDECRDLCETIELSGKSGRKPFFIRRMVDDFVNLLREIQAEMKQWSLLSYWKAFIYQIAIAESIAVYARRLDKMTKKFQVGALAHLATAAANPSRYEECRRKDREEAIHEFARPDFGDELEQLASDAIVKGEADDVRQAMGQVMQDLNEDIELDSADFEQVRNNLFIVSKAVGQLPTSLHIPPDLLQFDTTQAIGGSTIYDIYKGTYLTSTVAIKRARAFACEEGSVDHIIKEAKNWRSACEVDPMEEYILQLIGVSFPGESFIMVSRWKEKRDVMTYIRGEGENVDRRHLVRRIAKGLEILHDHIPPIAHGHLKASNIMINDRGNPLLGDFGLSKSLKNIAGQPMTEVQGVNSFRWFAPEMLDGDTLISTRSDIYSFAMTVLELMTGEVPFKHIKKATSVPMALMDGKRPERPTDPAVAARGLDDRLWHLLTRCWAQKPKDRPDILEINDELDEMWPGIG